MPPGQKRWVVYRTPKVSKLRSMVAVCTQGEWAAKEAASPGANTLVVGGIGNEGEAERLARELTAPTGTRGVARLVRQRDWAGHQQYRRPR